WPAAPLPADHRRRDDPAERAGRSAATGRRRTATDGDVMNAKKAWLLALYPRRWRARYGEEFQALLEDTPLSPRTVLDCLRGALAAHVRPDVAEGASRPAVDAPGAGMPADAAPTSATPLPITPRVPGQPGWESALDRILREARERGDFDNLPGTGQPLNLEEDPWAGEWALAYRVLK